MSIEEVTFYVAKCDRCGRTDNEGDYAAWADAEQARDVAIESDWEEIDDRLLCTTCWRWDDEPGVEKIEIPEDVA